MFRKITRIAAVFCALALATTMAAAQAGESKSSKSTTAAKTEPVDINTATKEQLDALPGIGEAYSQKIIDGRPYNSKHDLVTRKVLPQNVYDKIKNQIVAHHAGGKSSGSASPSPSPKK